MVASSYHFHVNAVAAFVFGIAVTFTFGIVQSGCYNGCQRLRVRNETTSFVVLTNGSIDDSPYCVPINTTFLYVCKDRETHQFDPWFKSEDLFRTCTSSGWLDGNGTKRYYSPYCVKRKKHCRSLPATSNPNIWVQIDGQNINVDKNSRNISVYYSVGTTVTYKCKDSKPNENKSQRLWRCKNNVYWLLKIWTSKFEWEPIQPNGKNLVCDNLPGEILVDGEDGVSPVPSFTVSNTFSDETQTDRVDTQIPSYSSNTDIPTPFLSSSEGDDKVFKEPSTTTVSFKYGNHSDEAQKEYFSFPHPHLLIGIFSSLGIVVLIAVLFGVLQKKRARLSKRYEDIADHARQIRFTSTPEEKNELEQNFAYANLQYVNIIPIEVNQEIIYTEVETGKTADKNSGPTMKRNIGDEQSTIYAEIHHSAIPNDQRR